LSRAALLLRVGVEPLVFDEMDPLPGLQKKFFAIP
jgi:hypothetical protein